MRSKLPTAVSVAVLLVVPLAIIFLVADRQTSFLDTLSSFTSASSSSSSVTGRHPRAASTSTAAAARVPKGCDIFQGEWVPDDGVPYYTNLSCPLIQEHQNCLKYGRPDLRFLQWRWRPAGCEMPRFDAASFLDAFRDRSLAFVGDSLARNHMQSLMCLLTKVAYPKDISKTRNPEFRTMHYESHNFTLAIFWSPFLVKANQSSSGRRLWNLFLDEPDESWASGVAAFDYVVLSAANWFTRPSVFYEAGGVVACHYCLLPGVPDLTLRYSLRMAFRAALRALTKFNGTVVVRTLSPTSHFEGGGWDTGGDCRRTRPYAANETMMAGLDLDFHTAQVEEFEKARKKAAAARLVLMNTTPAMLLRPDGHPSRYGHWPEEKVTLYNDCVHWCLPGPIDVWNEMLFQMLLTDWSMDV
ncbi:hypothetical protein PR202_gb17024 [Eleusine coracana subsp. coracana]|uniref:Trichome birefringence-like N-terminal domain-containing protein n=1 Tax=Eleusine coracana subsp. coracana TaxID=191504 RepID=A0AAV5F2I7_ELECO|nr:hypothetical protein PR202_gb17024 [Eleusine coracana subsp. coracana]